MGTNDRDENPFEIGVTGLVRGAMPEIDETTTIIADDQPTERTIPGSPTVTTTFEPGNSFRYIRRDTRFRDNDFWSSRQQDSA